ncbi:MAG TPA: hypothetical protein VLA19_20180, partial [Herpetosiphonaceae bacterium]|nr:hypothetical protein [Herpetosiphonaceae bacterium]
MSAARDEVLRRIKQALRDVPGAEASGDVTVPRAYRHAGTAPRQDLVSRFAERVAEYRARVTTVSPDELPNTITVACATRGVRRLVVPRDLPADWAPDGVELLRDEEL